MSDKAELYRLYDAGGRLLYIGVTKSAHFRLMQHVWKPWWPDVARKEVQPHKTRADALLSERNAICKERPIYNGQGRPPHTHNERLYMHERALAAIERAKLPGLGIRATRRYRKAAQYAIEAGFLLDGHRVDLDAAPGCTVCAGSPPVGFACMTCGTVASTTTIRVNGDSRTRAERPTGSEEPTA